MMHQAMCLVKKIKQRRADQGAALLLLLFLVVLFSLSFFISRLSGISPELRQQKKTFIALQQAKDALIAWSVLQGDKGKSTTARPGTLPCPDLTNNGTQGACALASGTTLGRLPWKTLEMDELHDANGDRLWYAVSTNFRGAETGAINSDTRGSLLLYAPDGVTLLTPPGEELAAIIFSPGKSLPAQQRVAGQTVAAAHLDSANGRNNALAAGPFISGIVRDAQGTVLANDLAVGISAKELISAVEKRVLNEAQRLLTVYAATEGAGNYPNPGAPNGANCAKKLSSIKNVTQCESDAQFCAGRFPENLSGSDDAPIPSWFQQNAWGRVLTYAVNKNNVVNGGGASCSPTLSLDGKIKEYILLAPGSVKSGQTRPSTNLVNYLDNAVNTNAWNGNENINFSAPSAESNDQLRSSP